MSGPITRGRRPNPRPTSSPRPRPRPSRSLGSRLMSGIRGIGSQIKSDFQQIRDNVGKPRSEQTQAYRDRTERSRTRAEEARKSARDRIRRRRARQAESVIPAPEDVQSPAEQTQVNQAMLNRMRMQQEQAARAANMDRARMMFERQNMMSPGPVPRQMQGLGGFRNPYRSRQRMPMFQMMPRNQATSPAFRYAGQNYDRLGGMQRTMPRPMEMMSSGERQQIGRMADRMEDPPIGLFQNQNPYVGILQRGISAKGGGRTMSQRPPSRFGMNPQLMATLASRFGGMNRGIF